MIFDVNQKRRRYEIKKKEGNMKKLKVNFSTLVFTAGLALSSIAQANDIKIGVSFRMLSDVGYKHG